MTGVLIGLVVSVSLAAGGTAPPPSVVVKVSGSGFHWGDAAVGVAATLATGLLVLGLVLTFRQTRGREP